MKGSKRKLSSWNIFVKKIYKEGKSKNPNFSFKDALTDASNRKGEMESMGSTKKMRKSHFNKSRSHHRRTRKNTRKHR